MRRGLLLAFLGLAYLGFLFALAEGSARVFWAIRWRVPVLHTSQAQLGFYPELASIDRFVPRHDDATFDVLLLSGSALDPHFAPIELQLKERLTQATHRPVRVHNAAVPGHTTLDSLYKYRKLARAGFELVAVYHGLNELRANNAPPELFRDDYSHYGWYELVRDVVDEGALYPFAAPYTVRFGFRRVLARLGLRHYVPTERPRADWMVHGREIRSLGPFRRNLEAIVALAKQRGERALLMTYASHIPPDYSEERFAARSLDYLLYLSPVELWGEVGNIRAGLAAHNAAVREIVASDPSVEFVDIAAAIPDEGRFYNDVCHLTLAGSERFVEALLPAVLRVMREEPAPPGTARPARGRRRPRGRQPGEGAASRSRRPASTWAASRSRPSSVKWIGST
jgi:hypothetical protein